MSSRHFVVRCRRKLREMAAKVWRTARRFDLVIVFREAAA
jgi:hypothetical protein